MHVLVHQVVHENIHRYCDKFPAADPDRLKQRYQMDPF